jgi:hypothetical protein
MTWQILQGSFLLGNLNFGGWMIKTMFFLLASVICSLLAQASEQNLRLTPDALTYTHETIEERGGVTYRRVEHLGKTYYMQLLGPQGSSEDMKVFCQKPDKKSEALVRVGVRTVGRSFAFVEGLRVACESHGREVGTENFRTHLLPELAIGFTIDDSSGPKFLRQLKNKRVIVWPFVGFAAEAP